jgi:sulfur carrier protein ThiS
MRLYLGGFFTFYVPDAQKHDRHWIEVELSEPAPLPEVLERLGIPPAEVHLVVVNGLAVDPAEAVVHPQDEVRLYPPIGGG